MPTGQTDHDAIVVGASIAGCTTATLLGRAGLRVALVERAPDPAAYKRICSHFIQGSAAPTIERLGVMGELERLGAVRSRPRIHGPSGWILPSPRSGVPRAVNLRRERLDPFLRALAAETPGVDFLPGRTVEGVVGDDGRVGGVEVRARGEDRTVLRAPLVVGADGRSSPVAALARVPARRGRHGRIAFGAYYEGPPPAGAPDASAWVLDPDWGAAFPTDSGLVFYAGMPTKDRLPEFRRDRVAALERFVGALPDAPPIAESRRVAPVLGRVDMAGLLRPPVAPGLALVGDAALAADPLWGVGCGWAFQSAEWLAEAVAPALGGAEPLEAGLRRYRRRHRSRLLVHAAVIEDFASGRRLTPSERLLFAAGVHDERVAARLEELGSRSTSPQRMLAAAVPRALAVQARRRRRDAAGRPSGAPAAVALASSAP